MNKTLITIACIVGVLLILIVPTCSSYNGMVEKEQNVEQKWAAVQTQYQRRLDLIPNLVNTVKGYAQHESTTLQNVTNARAGIPAPQPAAVPSDSAMMAAYDKALAAGQSGSEDAVMKAQQQLQRQAGLYINAVHEAYPDLKANENFMGLQDELTGTENRINFARQEYTQAVNDYNVKIRRFPANIVAGLFGFERKQQYEAEEEAAKAPSVQF